jgi:hypothetical protein
MMDQSPCTDTNGFPRKKNISGLAAIAQLFMVKLPSNIPLNRHVS